MDLSWLEKVRANLETSFLLSGELLLSYLICGDFGMFHVLLPN